MQRKSVLALVLILVLLAGVAIGLALGDRDRAANRVDLTGPHAVEARYENALRGYLALVDNVSASDPSEAGRQVHAADKALLLIRLADLAEQRGSSAESTRLTADASAVCSTAGLSYCSSVELRQRARTLDALLESMKRAP